MVYLLHFQFLPEQRLAALMADLFGVHLLTATIAGMSRSCAGRFQGFAAALRDLVAAAAVKHMDETGFRIGGKTQWLHIASTVWLTFYRVSPKRGSLLDNVLGIVVHDHWKPYYTLKGVLHALCNAHHLRELQALVEIEKEDRARKMQRLLRRACHTTNLAREQGITLSPRLISLIECCYDALLTEAFAFHDTQPALISTARKRLGRNITAQVTRRTSGEPEFSDQLVWLAGQRLQDIPPLLPHCRDERADDAEVLRGFRRAEAAGYFLAEFHHSPVPFRQIVGEGYGRIGQKAQHVLLANAQPQ